MYAGKPNIEIMAEVGGFHVYRLTLKFPTHILLMITKLSVDVDLQGFS